MSILVVAEKPSVAMALAKVLGATNKRDGYMEGPCRSSGPAPRAGRSGAETGYTVSWCVGHLVGLCDASEYDERFAKWRYEDLPIVPEEWKFKVMDSTRKQFMILKKLMNSKDISEIVCATDAGREGELIFRLVYEQAGCRKPIKRLWVSSMEESAIKKGFETLKDGSCYDALYESALCRAKADWLVGINASRLFSVLYRKNLKVGRVQTPTLAMIVERNQKIKDFKKERYYVTHLKFDDLDAVTEHLKTREEAEKIAADCKGRMCQVEKDDEQEKVIHPPKLFDLTSLQREANRLFGYTAQQTLDAAQSLYEKKLSTYPRTDSQYLTDDMEHSTRELIQALMPLLPFAKDLEFQPDIKRVLNSKKVSDHHAIIPTREAVRLDFSSLSERDRNVLYLIAGKLLMAIAEDHVYIQHKSQVTCNYHTFYVSAREIRNEGFRSIDKKMREFLGLKPEKTDDREMNIFLSKVYGSCDTEVVENYTQPPKQFTEDTLLSAMERAGNEDNAENTEKKGIGTPATRAAIIEKLIHSGFVKREKKNLVPTDEGNVLITVLPEEIKSPKMTAEWEMALNHIAQNTETADEFLDGITALMKEVTERYHQVSEENAFGTTDGEVVGICPICGSSVREKNSNFGCEKRDCNFALWKNDRFLASQGKRMDKATAKKLLSKGKIHYKDLVSNRTGRKYEATIVMVTDQDGKAKFNLVFPAR